MAKRSKVEPTRAPTLFELEIESDHTEQQEPERHEIPGFLLGTSSFTARGWEGSFYPRVMNSRDYLSFYAKQFRTVEIDSTFYGTPKPSTAENWKERTPPDFVFAVKIPQFITHEKILVDCDAEFDEFVEFRARASGNSRRLNCGRDLQTGSGTRNKAFLSIGLKPAHRYSWLNSQCASILVFNTLVRQNIFIAIVIHHCIIYSSKAK